jgi:hypothetical protein
MLHLASDSPRQYRDLTDTISGLIFLATPHISHGIKEDAGTAELLAAILRMGVGRKKRPPLARDNAICLKLISQQFALLKLRIPVLSCYETKPIQSRVVGIRMKIKDYVSPGSKMCLHLLNLTATGIPKTCNDRDTWREADWHRCGAVSSFRYF